ncbi:unnamed protein product [Rotaria magnacalcarata]|uniref:Integrase catalytic domain-containing protein n=1 Tax=Rotaria magnacalcarata TaxID=392030 RepID=A0A8S2XWU6_9BILA|nr:unnamed protein product [Rotaria magnacalcarata]
MYQLVQEFLDASLISESASPYAAPAMLIKKKDASFRFVVDYKRLNAITIKDSYPLPNMEDTIQKLVLNPPKCELAVQQIDYLGHTINKNCIMPMKEKIDTILQIQEPRTLAQANRFLGSLGWYRKFLPHFADVAAPIHTVTNLTKPNRRKFKWQKTQSDAFHQLKQMLITEPLFLHYPVDDLPLILTTDASDIGIGGVLQQEEYNIDKVVHIRGRYNCLPDYLSRYSKEQYDDLFDIEYGLASKNYQKSSTVTSYNNDILYKVLSNSKRSNEKCQVIYLPSSMIDSLLKACHDDPMTGAHFSTDRMYYKILNLFWWPGMKSSIQDYVKSCQLCKQFNISRNRKYGHLRSIPQPEGPFALVGIDYCGPLPITPRDNQYVLVVTDYFTRYITAIALPNCTAVTTAQALFNEYFCKFGIPSIILSDQGTHFQNTLMANLQKLIGYNHIYSTSYHPQTNGVVERFNATFVAQIAKLQCSQHNNWDEFLQPVVFAYNTGIHKSIKFSPYELLYGRAARLPIHPQPTHFIFNKPNDYFEQLRKTLRIFHQASKDNLRLQQQHSKIYYDRNRLNPQLSLGDRVLTRIHNSRGKLDPRFSSIPKVVVEIHHPVYVVEDEYTHEKSQVHISDLRPILSR